jgi:hypothetical protein
MTDDDDEEGPSWFRTLPGVLTAIAGVITAITGLVIGLSQTDLFGDEEPPPAAAPSTPAGLTPAEPRTSVTEVAVTNLDYLFQSPSGNIGCEMGTTDRQAFARCEIGLRTWSAPARPESCEGGWGDRVELRQGSAPHLECRTDTLRGHPLPILAYGDSWRTGSITCGSAPTAMTCTDASTGRSFSLSRELFNLN